MGIMSHEVRKHVTDVQREVAPDVPPRGRYLASRREPELEQLRDTLAAAPQRGAELAARDIAMVHPGRRPQPVLAAQGLDPAAPRVVHGCRDPAGGWR